jgi:toxin ParE1/3/4
MKQLRLTLSEAAAADIVEQADWYAQQSGPALGKRWEKAVTSAVLRIADRPRAGAVSSFHHAELANVRRVPIVGFPKHLVFYQILPAEILVLRVIHGARDLESLF